MPTSPSLHTIVAAELLQPLFDTLELCTLQRSCPSLSDSNWLLIGTLRALQDQSSGRAFLQWLQSQRSDIAPDFQHFFETLKSSRRLEFCCEANEQLVLSMRWRTSDALGVFSELNDFEVYAGDGHFHSAAAHDACKPEGGGKYPVGHVFCLNLRNHALTHLSVADSTARKREHDMRILKRQDIQCLRQGAAKGKKVLYIWDRAGIDFGQWQKWKQSSGIYFVSREKDNMTLDVLGQKPFDPDDGRNTGVLSDELVSTSKGVVLRRIVYFDVAGGREYIYLTNQMDLPPGIVAHLYKMRWDIEKVFDELKNKFGETKAWASSLTAKSMQAQFLCLAHNLLVIYEQYLETSHGIRNEAEIKRRAQRLESLNESLARRSEILPQNVRLIQRLTQRSVKFIRWIRCYLFSGTPYRQALVDLRNTYAVL
jgi:hypothetical protein